jgi:hypothetical protein
LIDISDPDVTTAFVTVLLPPAVVPPLVSFVAPVWTDAVVDPEAVGVPLTAHEMLEPAAIVAGGVGVQLPTVTPAGNPLIAHVAFVADAVAVALLVHKTAPEYATPIVAVAGKPERFGVMSEPVTAIAVVAVLFAVFGSFPAPVVPVTVDDPSAVGVPVTVHEITPDGATDVGGKGVHDCVKPAGRPETEQAAAVAVIAGAAAFEQVNVPL